VSILAVLIQFVFRVTFGVALAMGITPARAVSSGFYRVHLWVLMGVNTLASLCVYTQRESLAVRLGHVTPVLGLAIGLTLGSYLGAVLWLYERKAAGVASLFLVTSGGLLAALFATPWPPAENFTGVSLTLLDIVTSGLLLGSTLSAMFLGHWYLNTPTMELRPLRRLVVFMAAAVVTRMVVSGAGLVLHVGSASSLETVFWIFVTFRWLAGLLGTLVIALMSWYTLKIPNTQSATGILYAGVILAFIGELTSQFLSADTLYPV
jgi:hypothetical protein